MHLVLADHFVGLRAHLSVFSLIAIELNVPHAEFSLISIKLIFDTFRCGFKKAGSVLFDVGDSGNKDFLNPIT